MGIASANAPLFSLPGDMLGGAAAATGIALITSIGSLGGFAGPFLVGAVASRSGDIYGGLAIAGVSLFMSAALVLMLPKNV
jgi:ACS family tartrate transporter-like MFS transporter